MSEERTGGSERGEADQDEGWMEGESHDTVDIETPM